MQHRNPLVQGRRARAVPSLLIVLSLMGCATSGTIQKSALEQVRHEIGQPGDMGKDGVLTYDLVRSDLHTRLNGRDVNPALTMGGAVSFRALPNGQVLSTAELPVLRGEVEPVIEALRQGGILVSAIHNHHLFDDPPDIYVHGEAVGAPTAIAGAVRMALRIMHDPQRMPPAAQPEGLDMDRLREIIGGKGKAEHGLYTINVDAHPGTTLQGQDAPDSMGFEHEFHFAPTGGGQADVMAEFVLLSRRVNPVLDVLRQGGFTASALHNHFLTDRPRWFFVHASASGDAAQAAEIIHRALEASAG